MHSSGSIHKATHREALALGELMLDAFTVSFPVKHEMQSSLFKWSVPAWPLLVPELDVVIKLTKQETIYNLFQMFSVLFVKQ